MIQVQMRLFIVRHGQTSWNVEGRAQGHTDIALDETGLEQARALAAGFDPGGVIRTVFSSDLKRASQTAELLAQSLGAELVLRPELRERCFGECEGMLFPELRRRVLELAQEQAVHSDDVNPLGAETTQEVWDRLESFVDELSRRTEDSVVVSHGGTGTLLIARLINGTLATAKSFSLANTAYTLLERRPDGTFKMLSYNDTSHLGRSTVLSGGLEGSAR